MDFVEPEGAQLVGNKARCLILAETKLGIGVDVMPPFHHLRGEGGDGVVVQHCALLAGRRKFGLVDAST
jgi:hypothetical protein